MTDQAATNPAVERFLQFMTADIEGDQEKASSLLKEMLDAGEVDDEFYQKYLSKRQPA